MVPNSIIFFLLSGWKQRKRSIKKYQPEVKEDSNSWPRKKSLKRRRALRGHKLLILFHLLPSSAKRFFLSKGPTIKEGDYVITFPAGQEYFSLLKACGRKIIPTFREETTSSSRGLILEKGSRNRSRGWKLCPLHVLSFTKVEPRAALTCLLESLS